MPSFFALKRTSYLPGSAITPAEARSGRGPVPVGRSFQHEGGEGRDHPREDRGVPEGEEGRPYRGDRRLEHPVQHAASGHSGGYLSVSHEP
jgi:hypothetical protein